MSVVVPCFNVERYAAQTLASLNANAVDGMEFLLVDDASTDATPAVLAEGAERLPETRVLTHTVNRGLSAARNTGLAQARGRYLTFLDGDDVLAPGYLHQLLGVIKRLGCDFVRTDHVQVSGRQRHLHRVVHSPRGVVCPPRGGIGRPDRRSSVDSPHAWSGAFDRRLLEDGLLWFDQDLRTCEDRPWIWKLHLEARSFAVVGLRGVRYRRDVAGSLTRIGDERQLDFIPAFERLIGAVLADRDADLFLPKALRTYLAVLCNHLDQLDRYPAHLAERLQRASARSVMGLPGEPLRAALRDLDPERRATVRALLAGELRTGSASGAVAA